MSRGRATSSILPAPRSPPLILYICGGGSNQRSTQREMNGKHICHTHM